MREAHCPNIAECWNRGTATFMILGDVCTRACAYCQVTSGRPGAPPDPDEARRVALAVQQMGLRHAVVTSVNRDDQPDGGAGIFAATIRWIRRLSPGTTVEVLIPDFEGNEEALATVLAARPEILNHNTETVPRLYPRVRHKGHYERTLALLERAAQWSPRPVTKSGIMVGLGETRAEISGVLADLRAVDCDVLTVGQYLRPSPKHIAVARYGAAGGVRRDRGGGARAGVPARGGGAASALVLPRGVADSGAGAAAAQCAGTAGESRAD